ncbi:MAG: SbcC/MukB-like Walker B domain-containing protein [[Ruminococcus] torques]
MSWNPLKKKRTRRKKEQKILQDELQTIRDERARVQAELNNSDYGKKEQELKDLEYRIALLADNSAQWRQIVKGLKRWEEEDVVTDYVSNRALQLIQEIRGGALTEKLCKELRTHLDLALDNITNELSELRISIHETEKDIKEKQDAVEDLQNDRKPYPLELKKARQELQRALSDRYGRKIEVHIFADLFDITDEKWKNAIEGRLGRIKKSMITEPAYALDAAKIFRRMQQFEEVDLINSEAVQKDSPEADENSLYEAVHAESGYVDRCLKRYLGRIQKCETVEELSTVKDGVTPDCYSYSGYMFRHLRRKDYTKNACIGTKVSKAKLRELQEEIIDLQSSLIADRQTEESLKEARQFERFGQEPEHLMRLAGAADELADHYRRQDRLKEEIKELKNGTLAAELQAKTKELTSRIEEKEQAAGRLREKEIETGKKKGKLEEKIKALKERLDFLMKGYVPNDEIFAEVRSALETKSEAAYKKEMTVMAERLFEKETKLQDERIKSRNAFNNTYPAYGFSGVEHDNEVYDKVLERCRKDFEPKYKEEFEKQYELVYHSLRDNVIATIHGEIKSAYRHRRQINKMLSQIRFSDSIYQIDISPAKNENGQFYEMLMAEELDSKVIDHSGFDGQMSLMEDEFFRKYERKIGLLTEKFMPSREEDGAGREKHKNEMERFADYRNYLDFNMYEQSIDENGIEKKNYVDDMAGVDSGGEGQNPKYVALLAGFAMLYMQQSNRDSKIRLVLLDEAFSKMDKERSEVCLKYARELELQLIVCVPDERLQSLIRNVDSVYGFRRFRNQVTMMHIDKGNYLDMIAGESRSEEV